MPILKGINSVIAFMLEIAKLGTLAYWALGMRSAVGYILAFALPVIVIATWATYAAPRSVVRLQLQYLAILKLCLFGLAALGLYSRGHATFGIAFLSVALISTALEYCWTKRQKYSEQAV